MTGEMIDGTILHGVSRPRPSARAHGCEHRRQSHCLSLFLYQVVSSRVCVVCVRAAGVVEGGADEDEHKDTDACAVKEDDDGEESEMEEEDKEGDEEHVEAQENCDQNEDEFGDENKNLQKEVKRTMMIRSFL